MFTLMLPCAGSSTRYPNMRPKWSLTHPNGRLMITQGISGIDLSDFDSICMAVLKTDLKKYKLRDAIYDSFKEFDLDFKLLELDKPTTSQSETVSLMIDKLNIEGNIFIKDCDDYFSVEGLEPDTVCVYSLQKLDEVIAKNKSYVDIDNNGYVKTIVEKRVISELFCCGGYSFSDANFFSNTFKKLKKSAEEEEIYVSHIIYQQLLDGYKFKIKQVDDYSDWGTLKDWNTYRSQYKTIFMDLDGVLVESSSEYFPPYWGTTDSIQENVSILNKLYESGKVRIIITTSRKSSYKIKTIEQLERLGIKYHDIIFDLLHCERILVNDYSKTNPYPTAKSCNLLRNSNQLGDLLK
tara:strand:- start:3912 stop:4964 length:1053 start_codon:yes stop_codon:yes gene_type:complete